MHLHYISYIVFAHSHRVQIALKPLSNLLTISHSFVSSAVLEILHAVHSYKSLMYLTNSSSPKKRSLHYLIRHNLPPWERSIESSHFPICQLICYPWSQAHSSPLRDFIKNLLRIQIYNIHWYSLIHFTNYSLNNLVVLTYHFSFMLPLSNPLSVSCSYSLW